jgi:hypothetical protein
MKKDKADITGVQKHALSIAIFANYLILDTILCSIPRFLLLSLLSPLSSTLCSDTSDYYLPSSQTYTSQLPSTQSQSFPISEQSWEAFTASWTPEGCVKTVYLAQIALGASVMAATLLQFVGALCVREYARCLWVREMREEEWVRAAMVRGEEGMGEGSSMMETGEEFVESEEEKFC